MSLLIFKALHIIGFVAWFGGMFYLVRIFVYHAEAAKKENPERDILVNQFTIMEDRVYKIIMNPAMMITFTFGITMLVLQPAYLKMGWMHMKLTLLILLLAYHIYCKKTIKNLKAGQVTLSSFQFRMMNEIPTIFLLGIVLLAVLKNSVSPLIIGGSMLGFAIFIYIMAKVYQKKREG